MAIVATNLSAKLRLTDSKKKTVATFSGVKPDVDPDDILLFSSGLELLRGNTFGFHYLTVETELEDVI